MRESVVIGSGGLRLQLCSWGTPQERPILVLHGYLEQGAAWDAVARALGRHVVAPDHRGHGLSEHVGTGGFYHFWDYVADVDAVVTHLGGSVDLVGHSMGGTIACLYAGTRPEAVHRLVLVEGLGPPDLTSIAIARARRFLQARADPPTHGTLADLDAAATRMLRFNPRLGPELARSLAERITRPVDGGLVWTWDPLHRAAAPNPFDPRHFRLWVEAIAARTLVIAGADSPFRTEDLAERQRWLRDARALSIPGAGHLIHHDAPAALATAIQDFLEEP